MTKRLQDYMSVAYFRYYQELNDFLAKERKKVLFPWTFLGNPTVKFAIEAMGVPHVEVDMILANGQSVDFNYIILPEDRVSVYPVFESLDIAEVSHLRPKPLRKTRFILDVHLGKLAKYLRMLGFDSLHNSVYHDSEIIGLAEDENRIILTRDRDLLKNKRVLRGYWVRSQQPAEQLGEVLNRLDLKNSTKPLHEVY